MQYLMYLKSVPGVVLLPENQDLTILRISRKCGWKTDKQPRCANK